MNLDTGRALAAELKFALKGGWTFTVEGDRFLVKPPDGSNSEPGFDRTLRSEVWRIARFVGYANFVSIARLPGGGYSVSSHMASGEGVKIDFEPN